MLRVMSTAVLMIGDNDDHEDEYDNHVFLADSMWRPNTRALATRLSSWRARSSSQSTISNTIILVNTPLLVQQYHHVITYLPYQVAEAKRIAEESDAKCEEIVRKLVREERAAKNVSLLKSPNGSSKQVLNNQNNVLNNEQFVNVFTGGQTKSN